MNKTRKSNHRIWWLVTLVVIVLTGAVITWLVQTSSSAVVANVQVQVAEKSMQQNIKNVAGIDIGERITDLNLVAAASRISQLPQVRNASVNRRWPDRIVISVELREPIGWFLRGEELWYLDLTGESYLPKLNMPTPGLPKFTSRGDKLLEQAVIAYKFLPPNVGSKVVEVSAMTSSNIRFKLKSEVIIVWGSAERSERKAEVLQVLLQRKAAVYDVSAPDLPTIRLQ